MLTINRLSLPDSRELIIVQVWLGETIFSFSTTHERIKIKVFGIAMEKVCLFIFVACFRLTCASSFVYEESISDMLVQCNSYQSQMFDDDRTTHHCEKENFGANFSYVITEMETRYSKKSFWCFLFLKDDFYKLKFKLWLSHRDYFVDAVSWSIQICVRLQVRYLIVWSEISATEWWQMGISHNVQSLIVCHRSQAWVSSSCSFWVRAKRWWQMPTLR